MSTSAHEQFDFLDQERKSLMAMVAQVINTHAYFGRKIMFQVSPMKQPAPGRIVSAWSGIANLPELNIINEVTGNGRRISPDNVTEWL